MGKKKIKHLGKKRKSKGIQKIIMKSIIILGTVISLVALIYLNNTKELYEELYIESSAIEFYINMADEIGDKSVQLSWKELMAIDMVNHQNNLTNIKIISKNFYIILCIKLYFCTLFFKHNL